jgi:hypothetical protein
LPRSDLDERLAKLENDGFVARLRSRDASLWSADPATQAAIRERLGWLDLPRRWPAPMGRAFADEGVKMLPHAVLQG